MKQFRRRFSLAIVGAASLPILLLAWPLIRKRKPRPLPQGTVPPSTAHARTAAVIMNPVKVDDTFRTLVSNALAEHGFDEPCWIETTVDDPGIGMAQEALNADVDLVLIAGGDGTVRVVLGEFAGTPQRAAILPSGTGNLLARNLGIPLDADTALTLALTGGTHPIDLIRVDVADKVEYAAVMAGAGFDADVMGNTNEDLKKAIGVGAYVMAGMQQLGNDPLDLQLKVDDGDWVEKRASMVSIGNVGDLQGGISLMPAASASDGLLDVLALTATSPGDVPVLIAEAIIDEQDGETITRYQGKKVVVRVTEATAWQVDGDVIGKADEATFQVVPGAVNLVLPR